MDIRIYAEITHSNQRGILNADEALSYHQKRTGCECSLGSVADT